MYKSFFMSKTVWVALLSAALTAFVPLVESYMKENNAKVVALSSLLTMTMQEITTVHEALQEAGLRDGVKLIVGGAPLSKEIAKELGADDYGADGIDGVRRIKALLEE